MKNMRYKLLNYNIVLDKKTNLEWLALPDIDTDHYEAEEHIKQLGNNWKLPSLKELRTLYQKGLGIYNRTDLLKCSKYWVWSSELYVSSLAWGFVFDDGDPLSARRGHSNGYRVFAVRSRR